VVAILLFDGFSNLRLANAVEPLRAAKTLAGRDLYHWRFLSSTSEAAHSSSRSPETGIEGFNLADLVALELQRRGVLKRDDEGAFCETLRRKGQRYLPDNHPGAQYRRWPERGHGTPEDAEAAWVAGCRRLHLADRA
jgi:transcriptional regulator GlxA family with amidase domain